MEPLHWIWWASPDESAFVTSTTRSLTHWRNWWPPPKIQDVHKLCCLSVQKCDEWKVCKQTKRTTNTRHFILFYNLLSYHISIVSSHTHTHIPYPLLLVLQCVPIIFKFNVIYKQRSRCKNILNTFISKDCSNLVPITKYFLWKYTWDFCTHLTYVHILVLRWITELPFVTCGGGQKASSVSPFTLVC